MTATATTAGITLPAFALGCWAFGEREFWGDQDERDSIATVAEALELGITLFDTAESYGNGRSEAVLGRALALAGAREGVSIATKASPKNFGRTSLIEACERSLANLGSDYIDLYQLHWVNDEVPLAETFDALAELHARGQVRHVGVCNFGRASLTAALEEARRAGLTLTTNQLPYNLLWRAIEYDVAPACLAADIAVMAYSPLAQGLLTGKFAAAAEVPEGRARTRHFASSRPLAGHAEAGAEQETFAALRALKEISTDVDLPLARLALSWLLQRPAVRTVLVGARSPEQLRQTVAAQSLKLPDEVVRRLSEATDELKSRLGTNADLWRSKGRIV